MNQQLDDAVVRKIQLLLNLAERPGTEAEGAAAMDRAMAMLAKYNLELETVKDKVVAGGTAEREAEAKRDYAVSKRSAMYKWQQSLVRAIAEANFCVYWVAEVKELTYIPPSNRKPYMDYDEKGRINIDVKRHRVLGRMVNTTSVMVMVDYLLDTIERSLPYPQKERLSRDANIWREGCSERLCERIRAKAEAMKKADYATQGEQAYSTAIQVAGLVEREQAANYDFRYGAGAWAKKKARDAEADLYWSDAAIASRQAAREAKIAAERALETPAQRKAREAEEEKQRRRDERASARYSERYWREQDKQEERRNSTAYRSGRSAGNSINLDGQLASTTTKNLK